MKKILFYLLVSSVLVFASCDDPITPEKVEDKTYPVL